MGDYRQLAFRQVWGRLALAGKADGVMGAQYVRCLAAWVRAGRPLPIKPWVARWLLFDNQVPPAQPTPPADSN